MTQNESDVLKSYKAESFYEIEDSKKVQFYSKMRWGGIVDDFNRMYDDEVVAMSRTVNENGCGRVSYIYAYKKNRSLEIQLDWKFGVILYTLQENGEYVFSQLIKSTTQVDEIVSLSKGWLNKMWVNKMWGDE